MIFVILYTDVCEQFDTVDKNYFSSKEKAEQYLFDNHFKKLFGCEEYKKSSCYAEVIELKAFE